MAVHSFVDLSPNSTWLFCCTGRLGLDDALIYSTDLYKTLQATQATQRETVIIA